MHEQSLVLPARAQRLVFAARQSSRLACRRREWGILLAQVQGRHPVKRRAVAPSEIQAAVFSCCLSEESSAKAPFESAP